MDVMDLSTDPAVAFAMPSAGLDVQLYVDDNLPLADGAAMVLALAAAARRLFC